MKKCAFSYVELIFAMIFIVVMMVITLPFLSQRVKKNIDVFGEYRCWVQATGEFDENGAPLTAFYEQSRYNMDTLSEPVRVDQCVFNSPIGATNFKITLVGGGGGGIAASGAEYKENILNTSDVKDLKDLDEDSVEKKFKLKKSVRGDFVKEVGDIQYVVTQYEEQEIMPAINVAVGQGGGAGDVSYFDVPIASMPFNADGVLTMSLSNSPRAGNDSVGLASPVTDTLGNCSYLTLNVNAPVANLPANICSGNVCTAVGGALAVSDSKQTFNFEDKANYSVLIAGDGKFDVRVSSAGGRAGTGEECQFGQNFNINCLNSQRSELGIGVGAAGTTSLAQLNNAIARRYVRVRLLNDGSYMNQNNDIFLDENKQRLNSVPYGTDIINLAPAGKGVSGGGAIFIEW